MFGRRHGERGGFPQPFVMHQRVVVPRGKGAVDGIAEVYCPVVACGGFAAHGAQVVHDVAAADHQHALCAQRGEFFRQIEMPLCIWGRYYFDTFIDKAKKGEIFKGNKILNKNSGKIGFDTFRLKLVESNLTLIPFLHDFDEVLG